MAFKVDFITPQSIQTFSEKNVKELSSTFVDKTPLQKYGASELSNLKNIIDTVSTKEGISILKDLSNSELADLLNSKGFGSVSEFASFLNSDASKALTAINSFVSGDAFTQLSSKFSRLTGDFTSISGLRNISAKVGDIGSAGSVLKTIANKLDTDIDSVVSDVADTLKNNKGRMESLLGNSFLNSKIKDSFRKKFAHDIRNLESKLTTDSIEKMKEDAKSQIAKMGTHFANMSDSDAKQAVDLVKDIPADIKTILNKENESLKKKLDKFEALQASLSDKSNDVLKASVVAGRKEPDKDSFINACREWGSKARTKALGTYPMTDNAVANGIVETANSLGISPLDLATAISYETAGTFDPTKPGPTTRFGRHRGLIQFGEPQARQYGVDWSNPVGSQLGANGAVARYLRNAGVKPGMGLLDIYSAINAGTVGRYDAVDGSTTVRQKVESMGAHRKKAAAFLGTGENNTGVNPIFASYDPCQPSYYGESNRDRLTAAPFLNVPGSHPHWTEWSNLTFVRGNTFDIPSKGSEWARVWRQNGWDPNEGYYKCSIRALTMANEVGKLMGEKLTVTSAYRSPYYNRKVGGVGNSYHMKGLALDILTSKHQTARAAAKRVGFGGIGFYSWGIHMDLGPSRQWGSA